MAENNHEKEAICFSKNLLIILLFGLILGGAVYITNYISRQKNVIKSQAAGKEVVPTIKNLIPTIKAGCLSDHINREDKYRDDCQQIEGSTNVDYCTWQEADILFDEKGLPNFFANYLNMFKAQPSMIKYNDPCKKGFAQIANSSDDYLNYLTNYSVTVLKKVFGEKNLSKVTSNTSFARCGPALNHPLLYKKALPVGFCCRWNKEEVSNLSNDEICRLDGSPDDFCQVDINLGSLDFLRGNKCGNNQNFEFSSVKCGSYGRCCKKINKT